MEINVDDERKSIFPVNKLFIAVILFVTVLVVFAIGGELLDKLSIDKISKENISVRNVEHGDLQISRSGHGKIKALRSKWVITNGGGYVEEILKKPGEFVKKGDVLLTLSNVELEKKVYKEEQLLIELKEEFNILKAELEEKRLRTLSKINNIKSQFTIASIELEAFEKLKSLGVTSKIDYEKQQLLVENISSQLTFERKSSVQSDLVHDARIAAMTSKIQRQESAVKHLKTDLELLEVKATESGLLNQMNANVVLGKNIPQNTALAEITDTRTFYAEVEVAISVAKEITIGMKAFIDINSLRTEGVVTRINPRANNGRVILDIKPINGFSRETLTDQPISALIITETYNNVFYLKGTGDLYEDVRIFHAKKENDLFTPVLGGYKKTTTGEIVFNSQDIEQGDLIALVKKSALTDNNTKELRIN